MPLYEYQCEDCGETFEKMVRFSEADKNPECPRCKTPHTHKKISMFASRGSVSLSGSGASSCGSSRGFT